MAMPRCMCVFLVVSLQCILGGWCHGAWKNVNINCHLCICEDGLLDCTDRNLAGAPRFSVTHLKKIIWKKNFLTEIPELSFKANSDLVEVDLSHNQLETLPPLLFQNLRNLTILDLSFNHMSYRKLPSELLGNLVHLSVLSMNNQGLRQEAGVPAGFFENVTALEELHVTGMPTADDSFRNLESLKLLNLGDSHCKIQTFSFNTYGPLLSLKQVKILSLRNCDLVTIDADMFALLSGLARLDVSCNEKLGKQITQTFNGTTFPLLQVFLADRISGALFEGELDFDILISGLPKLQALSLRYNMYVNPMTLQFSRVMPYLRYLNLENHIEGFLSLYGYNLPTAISHIANILLLPHLRELDLSGLTTINFYKDDLHCVETPQLIIGKELPWEKNKTLIRCNRSCLDLILQKFLLSLDGHKKIDGIALKQYFNVSPVKILHLRHWQFAEEYFFKCSHGEVIHLEAVEIDFSYTRAEGGVLDIGCVVEAPQLETLLLRSCYISKLFASVYHGLPKLSFLDLANNELGDAVSKDTQGELFGLSKHLKTLDLSSNGLFFIPEQFFKGLVELRVLLLQRNDLEIMPPSAVTSPYLEVLDVRRNRLKYFSPSVFERLSNRRRGLDLRLDRSWMCNCTDEWNQFATWFSSPAVLIFKGKQLGHNSVCTNVNMSVAQWANNSKDNCPLPSSPRNPTWTSVDTILITLIPLLFTCVIFTLCYTNRYELLYNYYRLRYYIDRHLKSPEDVPLVPRASVYLAGDNYPELTAALEGENISWNNRHSSFNEDNAASFSWERVAMSIQLADIVVIVLAHDCLKTSGSYREFFLAIQKRRPSIVPIIKGDISDLLKRNRAVRKVLMNPALLIWDPEDEANFSDNFTAIIRAKL